MKIDFQPLCKNCMFYRPYVDGEEKETGNGECCLNPPVVHDRALSAHVKKYYWDKKFDDRPRTSEDDVCREWSSVELFADRLLPGDATRMKTSQLLGGASECQ